MGPKRTQMFAFFHAFTSTIPARQNSALEGKGTGTVVLLGRCSSGGGREPICTCAYVRERRMCCHARHTAQHAEMGEEMR